jgi:hypothetical protein
MPSRKSTIRSWTAAWVSLARGVGFNQEVSASFSHQAEPLFLPPILTVGPVPIGVNSFDFTCAPPQPSLLPSTSSEEILGVTVLILTASYRDKEFVRVGYYVNTEYEDEARRAEPPAVVDFTGLIRNVLVEKPRVTRFNNPWDSELKSNPWGSNAGDASGQAQGGNVGSEMAGGSGSMQDLDVGGKDLLLDSPLPPPVVAAVAGATSAGAPNAPAGAGTTGEGAATDVDMA